ncbi:MAG: hypothetical protein ACRDJ4_08820 [Actinomycetota bacterium]
MKCPSCARLPRSAVSTGRPRQYAAAVGGGLATAALIGAAVTFLRLGIGGLLLMILAGLGIGEVVSRAGGRHGHGGFQVIAVLVTLVGLPLGAILAGLPLPFAVNVGALIRYGLAAIFAAIRVSR